MEGRSLTFKNYFSSQKSKKESIQSQIPRPNKELNVLGNLCFDCLEANYDLELCVFDLEFLRWSRSDCLNNKLYLNILWLYMTSDSFSTLLAFWVLTHNTRDFKKLSMQQTLLYQASYTWSVCWPKEYGDHRPSHHTHSSRQQPCHHGSTTTTPGVSSVN